MRLSHAVQECLQDLRYAARIFAQSPGFSAAIILTMALAIGANSAIFSVIHGVLLRPLAYPQANRLVRMFLTNEDFPKFSFNPNDFKDYRERSHSFESMAAYIHNDVQVSGNGQPALLPAAAITAGFFHVLGAKPFLGREFTTADELPANSHVVILSNRLWRSRFSADPSILGGKVLVNAIPFTVVGIMPPGIEHPGNSYHPVGYGDMMDLWIPFAFEENPSSRGSHYLDSVGRLKDGVTPAQAQAELTAIMAQMAREHPDDKGWQVTVTPLAQEVVGKSSRVLWILLGAAGVVLLIACVNAANLLLARATVRQREIAVRAALGAPRRRLIRQLLTESVCLSLAGAVLGAGVAVGGVRALVSLLPANFPRSADIHVNAVMFVFTLVVAVLTGVLFGVAPAWQGSNADLTRPLREGGRGTTTGSSVSLRNVLVVGEVALACLLLIGAGLVLRSFVNLLRTEPGFLSQGVLTATIWLPWANYQSTESTNHFYDQLAQRLASVPGVSAAGVATDLPWTGYDDNTDFRIEGKTPPPDSSFHARYHSASTDYFQVLNVPLISGRFFTARDTKDSRPVLIVNRAMARHYWPNEEAVGKRITFARHPEEKDWITVAGVVDDIKDAPASAGAEPAFWWPVLQRPYPIRAMTVAVQVSRDPVAVASEIRRIVGELDPNLAVAHIRSMDEIVQDAYSAARFALFLFGLFAALALVLAAIGTYGVISYSMNQRAPEFGVRMALGAKPADLIAFVFSAGMKLALTGAAAGVAGGLLLSRLLGSLLYGVGTTDPLTIILASVVVVLAAAAACYLPARRAARNDPMTALRAN